MVAPGVARRRSSNNRVRENCFQNSSHHAPALASIDGEAAPVEQLQRHRVSVVVGHHVHPLVAEAQVSNQSLHHAGLLKYGILVRPLRKDAHTHAT